MFWSLDQINPDQIEAPKVPSGMTGGVEYEAMSYCVRFIVFFRLLFLLTKLTLSQTAHLRLINSLARSCPTIEEAFKLHDDLFSSGLERVLMVRFFLPFFHSLLPLTPPPPSHTGPPPRLPNLLPPTPPRNLSLSSLSSFSPLQSRSSNLRMYRSENVGKTRVDGR